MINEKRWQNAQIAENNYWANVTSKRAGILNELTEHVSDILPLLKDCFNHNSLKGIEIGIGSLGIGFLAVYFHQYFSKFLSLNYSSKAFKPYKLLLMQIKSSDFLLFNKISLYNCKFIMLIIL